MERARVSYYDSTLVVVQAMSWERTNRQLRRQTEKDNQEVLRNLTETTLLSTRARQLAADEDWKALAKETMAQDKALLEEWRAKAEAEKAKEEMRAREEAWKAEEARAARKAKEDRAYERWEEKYGPQGTWAKAWKAADEEKAIRNLRARNFDFQAAVKVEKHYACIGLQMDVVDYLE